jgi:hypothetical protein
MFQRFLGNAAIILKAAMLAAVQKFRASSRREFPRELGSEFEDAGLLRGIG